MFDVTERVRTGLNLFDSDNVLRLFDYASVLACNECCLFFLRQMAVQMNLGINETACVMQILLQPGRQTAQLKNSSVSNMVTYYRQLPSELNM
jgi:hypothetical protein